MKVKEILKFKGPAVFTIGKEALLRDATAILVNNNIGVLMVIDTDGRIVGVLSERDIVKAIHHSPDNFGDLKVADKMTSRVIVVEPEDDLEYVENILTENRIRHLPVLQDKILVGIISIGDVVKYQLSSQRFENKYLKDYISGIA